MKAASPWEGKNWPTEAHPFSLGDKIPDGESVVYFVAAPGRVKVGCTRRFSRRFNNLNWQDAGHLTIVGWTLGDKRSERALHVALKEFRVDGEWFRDCAEVRNILEMVQSGKMILPIGIAPRNVDPRVQWACEALRKIAGVRSIDESMGQTIDRVANRLKFSRWRTFDLWYRKAHRLEEHEFETISDCLGSFCE